MRTKVFLSYHYNWDRGRADAIRGLVGANAAPALSDSGWARLLEEGDHAVARWFAQNLERSQCAIVLISGSTRGRRLIDNEIYQSWKAKRGVLGIYVHNLPDVNGHCSHRGPNPFADFEMTKYRARLSDIVRTYDPPYQDPWSILNYISYNLANWVQDAISIRRNY